MKRSATATKSAAKRSRSAMWRAGTKLPSSSLAKVGPISATASIEFMLSCIHGQALTSADG